MKIKTYIFDFDRVLYKPHPNDLEAQIFNRALL